MSSTEFQDDCDNDSNQGWDQTSDQYDEDELQPEKNNNEEDDLNSGTCVTALEHSDIEAKINKKVEALQNLIFIDSRDTCLALLKKYKWNEVNVAQVYFGNEENCKKEVGLEIEKQIQNTDELCPVCYGDSNDGEFVD